MQILLVMMSLAMAYAQPVQSFGEKHIYINTFEQYIEKIIFGSLGAIVQYVIICSIVEYYNPMPKNKLRYQTIFREIRHGVVQLSAGCITTMSFYYYIYPHTPYYKYYEYNDYGIFQFIYGIIFHWCYTTCKIYNKLVFSYWIHRLLHTPFLYKHIHSVHHSFKEPTCFSYCAAMPLEGMLEGNLLLHTAECILPIHPAATLFYGTLMAFNDLFAHDGGPYDFSDHYRHHLYYTVNYGDPHLDNLFGTQYQDVNIHQIQEKLSYKGEVLICLGFEGSDSTDIHEIQMNKQIKKQCASNTLSREEESPLSEISCIKPRESKGLPQQVQNRLNLSFKLRTFAQGKVVETRIIEDPIEGFYGKGDKK